MARRGSLIRDGHRVIGPQDCIGIRLIFHDVEDELRESRGDRRIVIVLLPGA
jgi:hypothetical protein